MKKIIRYILTPFGLFTLLIFIFALPSLSQSPTEVPPKPEATESPSSYDQSFQEYLSKLEDYEVAHQDYVLKRAQYLRFGTLKSREEVQKSTLAMLQKRDEVVIYYIKTLRERIGEAVGVSDSKREALNFRLGGEIGWFENHQEIMTSAGSLSDLVEDSDGAKERFSSFQPLAYEVLATVSLGRIIDFNERINDSFTAVKAKVEEIKKEEREEYKLKDNKVQVIDRWLFESENRIIRGEEKQLEAEGKISDFGVSAESALNEHNQALVLMGEAQLFYKEAGSFMKEVMREVKIEN